MLVQLVTLPCPISDRERTGALHHESNRILRDLHLRGLVLAGRLELFVRNAVRHKTAFEANAAGLELIGSTGILTVNETHKLRGGVPVVVRWSVLEGSINMSTDEKLKTRLTVWLATSHLGEKMRKSASGAVGSRDGAVRTQNIDGSI